MSRWSITLLGAVGITHDGTPVDVGGPTARAVLAALALRADLGGTDIDELITLVWNGPAEVSRDNVYQYVKKLRDVIGGTSGPQIASAGPGRYRLALDGTELDWHRFTQLVKDARSATQSNVDEACELFTAALSLWPGPALANIGDRLRAERRRLGEHRLAVIEELAGLEGSRGHPQRVHDLLAPELVRSPHREIAAELMIRALTALGRREEAGAVFHRTRQLLKDQLGLDPSAPLAAAHRDSLAVVAKPSVAKPSVEMPPATGPSADPGLSTWSMALPRQDRHFIGRAEELALIRSSMARDDGFDMVCAVWGMAGVGKTALVVRAAAETADLFPDGCLFVDLGGLDAPVDPADALGRMVRWLGGGQRILYDLDERIALYRTRLAGRRLLVVLDDAASLAQVLPLLPGVPGCGAIITSRIRLTALDDAEFVDLPLLPPQEAAQLFRTVVGAQRLRPEPVADRTIGAIVGRCAGLPLAVRIVAARHRVRGHSLADLSAELASASSVVTTPVDGGRSVAASLMISVADLSDDQRRMFALFALHPGPDLGLFAVAALAGTTVAEAVRLLDGLVDRHLVGEPGRHRYQLHDLVAAFARDSVTPTVAPADRSCAMRRLIDFYLRAADRADAIATPHRTRIRLEVEDHTAELPPMPDYDQAAAWFIAEQANLAALCLWAGQHDLDTACWQLAFVLRGHYFRARLWQPWLATHTAALTAARRSGDAHGEAVTRNNLGLAHVERGAWAEAAEQYAEAIHLFGSVADRRGEITARANQAWILFGQDQYEQFLDAMTDVLAFYRENGTDHNTAITLRGIAIAETKLDRCQAAVDHLLEALAIVSRLDSRLDMAMTLNALGEAHCRAGDLTLAADAYRRAIDASLRGRSDYELARAHHGLGEIASQVGDADLARSYLSEARRLYEHLGAAEAGELAARLTG